MCVQVCLVDALTYEEREEEMEAEEEKPMDLEIALNSLANKYGWQEIVNTIVRMTMAKKE
jgi:benzoyl-CoA reductase subunit BamC